MDTKNLLLKKLYSHYPLCSSFPVEFQGATKVVYGEGNPNANIMIIGEAPGKKEDELGRPYVGRSGELLNRTLESVNINRNDVFITNVVKCRPPNNRTPLPLEIAIYKKLLLLPEIEIINPKIIIATGSVAMRALLDIEKGITKARGIAYHIEGRYIVPTYHPAYILRNPART